MAETIWLSGEGGGAPIPHDLPLHWAIQEQLDKKLIMRVSEDGTPWVEPLPVEPTPDPDPDEVPDGSVADVLAWVGDDLDRAARALEVELARGDHARKGVVDPLAKLTGNQQ